MRILSAVLLSLFVISLASCSSNQKASVKSERIQLAKQILNHPRITLMRKQVSGRVDGASAYDNVAAASRGYSGKRSSYGHAPGGYTKMDIRMLRCIKRLADSGYSF